MGDINQHAWIMKYRDLIKGPVLEIGARHYSKDVSIDYRSIASGVEYIGTDMLAGDNVDIVINFTADIEEIRAKLNGKKINTIICCSVLEHVDNVFKIAENISKILDKGGVLFISVPFHWRFHGYPNDYWRFTPEGLKYLFKDFEFSKGMTSTNVDGDMHDGTDDPNGVTQKLVPKNHSLAKRILMKLGLIDDPFKKYQYLLAPSMISMVGIKK